MKLTLIIPKLLIVFVTSILFISCDSSGKGSSSGHSHHHKIVTTTFYPTTYFAKRIAKGHADVICPVPPEEDPIYWKPTPEALKTFQESDLIVLNGAQFEKWVEKVSLPINKVVSTAASFEKRWLHYDKVFSHSHGPGGEHTHEGIDGHTWLNPILAIEQAKAILDGMVKMDPHHASLFKSGFESLKKDLLKLDAELVRVSQRLKDTPLFCSHPAFNYLAKQYNWNIHNLDLDPEAVPDKAVMDSIREALEHHHAKILLWESAPSPEIATIYEKNFNLRGLEFSPAETNKGENSQPSSESLKSPVGGAENKSGDNSEKVVENGTPATAPDKKTPSSKDASTSYLSIQFENIRRLEKALEI